MVTSNKNQDPPVKMNMNDPYLINPLFVHQKKHDSTRKIIHSIVTPIPITFPTSQNGKTRANDTTGSTCSPCDHANAGEIEIVIEECHEQNSVTRRVTVRSYGDVSDTEGGMLHASFSLPITPLPKQHKSGKKDWICWADFDGKTLLCVLTGPEKLRIFDVYPSFSKKSVADGGGGHSVSLPFEASGIFALDGFAPGGLLIQRQCDPVEVGVEYNARVNVGSPLDLMIDGDSTGIVSGPPSTLRLGVNSKKFRPRLSTDGDEQLSSASSCSSDSDIERMVSPRQIAPEDLVPTLYTLHNPLDEPRPCGVAPTKGEEQSPNVHTNAQVWRSSFTNFCDASERVIFVGKPRNFLREMSDILVVTFHEQKKCHKVWVLREAPPPPKAVPLWKLTSRKSKAGSMSMSESVSPFSDLQAMASMACIHNVEVGDLGSEASRVFLATTTRGSGDFILCLLLHSNVETNECLLQCVDFNPLRKKANGGNSWEWDMVKEFKLPCRSALPIEATKINLRSFSIRSDFDNDELPQRLFLQREFGSHNPKALDILLCGSDGSFNIFRGGVHVIDIDVPLPQPQRLRVMGLSNVVSNRVDIIYGEENSRQRIRILCSLTGARSMITESVLSAIGSALLDKSLEENGDRLFELYFAIRADCLKFAQLRSLLLPNQHKSDDIEWESLSLVLFHFITIASGGKVDLSPADSDSVALGASNNDAWTELLQSNFHSTYVQKNSNRIFLKPTSVEKANMQERTDSSALLEEELVCLSKCKCIEWISNHEQNSVSVSSQLFDAMHMLHEDLKIKNGPDSLLQASLLAELLCSLCDKSMIGGEFLMKDYIQHYRRNIPSLDPKIGKTLIERPGNIPNRLSSFNRPPCFYSWLEAIMRWDSSNCTPDLECFDESLALNGMCLASGALLRFYFILFSKTASSSTAEIDRKVISAVAEEGIHDALNLTNICSPTLLLPLLDALHRCRLNPPSLVSDFSPGAFELIGRNDLAQIKTNCKPSRVKDSPFITDSFRDDDPENDGLVTIEKYAAMLFPNDTRMREAARMLRSSRPLFLRVKRAPEVNDHDYERLKQQRLALLCRRLLPLPVGRGMITIGAMDFVPIEPLVMPKICLAGRIPPQNQILALEDNRCTSKHKMWPDFHNGVAAGLRLPVSRDGARSLSRTFIVSNKPKPTPQPSTQPNQQSTAPEPDYTYGGFLLALGLRGHLSALTNTDICDYINEGPVTTAVGLMIGLAANKRGTCDVTIQKTMMVHIPSLLPTSFRSIDLPSSVQTAAVAGVGLLCQGSSHRLLTEFLLNEMGKRPTVDQNTDDRESYTLCCGISLGMVNLCLMDGSKRTVNDGLADLNIEERLHRYIVGGVDENAINRGKSSSDRTNGSGNVENEKCSRIFEGGRINTDITAPGATLALGMIFHRSG